MLSDKISYPHGQILNNYEYICRLINQILIRCFVCVTFWRVIVSVSCNVLSCEKSSFECSVIIEFGTRRKRMPFEWNVHHMPIVVFKRKRKELAKNWKYCWKLVKAPVWNKEQEQCLLTSTFIYSNAKHHHRHHLVCIHTVRYNASALNFQYFYRFLKAFY